MTKRIHDHNGWYQIKGNPLSKSGIFEYSGRSIAPVAAMAYKQVNGSFDLNKAYKVYRSESELSSNECINSFKLLPWIDEHVMLGSREAGRTPAEYKGIEGVIGEDVYFEDGVLRGNIKVLSENLKDLIDTEKNELSCGYACEYEYSPGVYKGEKYDFIQTKIRGNHLALTDEGRMGADVAVLDSMTVTFDSKEFKEAKMYDNEKKETEDTEVIDQGFSDTQLEQIRNLLKEMSEIKSEDEEADQEMLPEEVKDEENNPVEELEEAAIELAEAALSETEDEEEEEDEKESEKNKSESATMDSIKTEIKALKKAISKQSQGLDSVKSKINDETARFKMFAREINKRNELAKKLESQIGVFDHSEMTAAQVAKYGADKLGIKCDKGHEATALDVYFQAINSISSSVSMDSKRSSGISAIDNYFNR